MDNLKTAGDSSFIEESLVSIGKDSLKYVPSKLMGTLANLMLVPLYTNLLNPDQYGLYNVATAVISFLAIIFSDWVGVAGLRFFREHYNADNVTSYFSTLLFLLVSNLLIMYLLGFLFFEPLKEFFKIPSKFLILVFLLLIPIAVRALLFQVLRAQIKPLAYTSSVIINQFMTIGIALYFIIYWKMGALAILLGMGISIVFIDVVMLFQTKFLHSLNKEEIRSTILNGFYTYGIPIAASSLGVWIITQSNKFILQYFKGSYYNGQLGVGFNLTYSILMPLFAIITLAAIPRIINSYESGKDVNPIVSKLTGYLFAAFIPIVIILCLYPKEVVLLFSNAKYSEASVLIPFLAVSAFAFGLAEYTTLQYHLTKKTYIDTIIRLIPGVIGIALNVLMIPKLGLLGVGIATLASNLLYLVLSMFIKVDNFGWQAPNDMLFKCFVSSLAGFGMVIALRHLISPDTPFNFVFHVLTVLISYTFVYLLMSKKLRFTN